MKSFAELAGISYYSLYEFMKRRRPLKDEDIAKILQAIGYNLIPERRKLVYEVCEHRKVDCHKDIFLVPIYSSLDEEGVPDFKSKVGVACISEPSYCLEVYDNRSLPFSHRSVVVAYKPIKDITGDGYYLLMLYSNSSVLLREVQIINGFIVIKLYNPEGIEIYNQNDLKEKMKVVGKVLEFTVRVA